MSPPPFLFEMGTIGKMLATFEALDTDKIAAEALAESSDGYEEILREQLLEGKGSDGQDLKPGYLEDPYFKSPESAQRYLEWKQKISPSAKRNPNAPNLYIDGSYHRSIKVKGTTTGLTIDSNIDFAGDIERKYQGKANKLGGAKRVEFVADVLQPNFKERIQKATGLKMK